MEGSNLVFTVGADSRMSICSKTANSRRFDQQLHVALQNVPNSLCFVDTLSDNMVLSCSNSNYLLQIKEIAQNLFVLLNNNYKAGLVVHIEVQEKETHGFDK